MFSDNSRANNSVQLWFEWTLYSVYTWHTLLPIWALPKLTWEVSRSRRIQTCSGSRRVFWSFWFCWSGACTLIWRQIRGPYWKHTSQLGVAFASCLSAWFPLGLEGSAIGSSPRSLEITALFGFRTLFLSAPNAHRVSGAKPLQRRGSSNRPKWALSRTLAGRSVRTDALGISSCCRLLRGGSDLLA